MALKCRMSTSEQGRCPDDAVSVGLVRNFYGWSYTAVCGLCLSLLRGKMMIGHEEPPDPTKWSDDGAWIGGDE